MSVEIDEQIPGMAEANAELDRLMAADAPEAGKAESGKLKAETGSADQEQRAAQSEVKNAQDSATKTTDIPSTADPKEEKKDHGPRTTDDGTAKPLSRFEKAKQREQKGWEALNAEKAALKAEQERLQSERTEFETKAKASREQFSPEQYEKAAAAFEAEGKFDLAELAKKKAEEIRKNPPAQVADQAKVKHEAQVKEWTLKAGTDFPELGKQGSPLNKRVQEMFAEEPDLKAHPKGVYLAARLASLEADADGVPAMTAELGKLRARVKELEVLTAPGGGGNTAAQLPGVKTFEQMNDAEQLSELQKMARDQVLLR